jgi:hypothetical protein
VFFLLENVFTMLDFLTTINLVEIDVSLWGLAGDLLVGFSGIFKGKFAMNFRWNIQNY